MGKNKLLGIGMNVDEKTMSTDGVKLTMFDISDPENVKEEQTYVIENVYYTDVSYDYKAALVDAEKNLIGFCCRQRRRPGVLYIFLRRKTRIYMYDA